MKVVLLAIGSLVLASGLSGCASGYTHESYDNGPNIYYEHYTYKPYYPRSFYRPFFYYVPYHSYYDY